MKKLIMVLMMVVSTIMMADTLDDIVIPDWVQIHFGDDEIPDSLAINVRMSSVYNLDTIEKGIVDTHSAYVTVKANGYAETKDDMDKYVDFLIWVSAYSWISGPRPRESVRSYENCHEEECLDSIVGEAMNNHMLKTKGLQRVYKIGKNIMTDDIRQGYLVGDGGPLYCENIYNKWTTMDGAYYDRTFITILRYRLYDIMSRGKISRD